MTSGSFGARTPALLEPANPAGAAITAYHSEAIANLVTHGRTITRSSIFLRKMNLVYSYKPDEVEALSSS
jgi:hypothetical protein